MPQTIPQALGTLTSTAILAEGAGRADWVVVVDWTSDNPKIDRQKRSKLKGKFYYKIGRIPEDAGFVVLYVGEEVEEDTLPANYAHHSSHPQNAISIHLRRFGKCNDVYCLLDEGGEMPVARKRFRMKTWPRMNKLAVEKVLDAAAYVEHALKGFGRFQNKITSD